MKEIAKELVPQETLISGLGIPLNNGENPSWLKAIFNISHVFYYLAFAIGLIVIDYFGFIQ